MTTVITQERRLEQTRAQVWPLWREVAAAWPELILEPLPAPDAGATPASVRYAAYRTVVELADALSRVCAEGGTGVPEAAAEARSCADSLGLHGDRYAAVIAGEVLAAGLRGRRAQRPARVTDVHGGIEVPARHHDDLMTDLQWWRLVTRTYNAATEHRHETALLAA